ncbi:hypothetical protein BC938DRAFT_484073 [Jimgerdemannia flammicorona]|uniref:Uncharacterized protein n=1 Tax=Jimgerdemannia flammicorona TaxID=994334 RepID=A0A433QAM2_9FUNG|nr:hypothetical protein BC938DRAFT_484073 [Jimgerdemannia flammicorona]
MPALAKPVGRESPGEGRASTIDKHQENKKIWETSRRIASLNEESKLVDLELEVDKLFYQTLLTVPIAEKGLQAGLKIARRGFQLYSDIEFDTEERERKRGNSPFQSHGEVTIIEYSIVNVIDNVIERSENEIVNTRRPTKISSSIQAKTVEQLTSDEDQRSVINSHEDNSGSYHSEFDLEGEERVESMESDIEDEEDDPIPATSDDNPVVISKVQEVTGGIGAVPKLISSSSSASVLKKYCAKPRTSNFDPARSYILDLTPTSKIINEFSSDEWTKLLTNKYVKASRYHHEIETITNKLFGPVGVRVNIDPNAGSTMVESVELSSRSLTQRRILLQQGTMEEDTMVGRTCRRTISPLDSECDETEWMGDYVVPLLQGALKLDGMCRVRWGEISVRASQDRRNHDKDVLVEAVDRAHLADLLCQYESHEIVCLLACGGPYNSDVTKLASDEFQLQRMLKDMLDVLHTKFHRAKAVFMF